MIERRQGEFRIEMCVYFVNDYLLKQDGDHENGVSL